MADASLQFFEHVLDERWQTTYDGENGTRINEVPKPEILIATDENVKRVDPRRTDVLFVREGGAQSHTPRTLGRRHKRTETMVTLDFRTTESRARLEGTRDENNDKEAYGGLRGECERILDELRTGHKEYDWIDGYEWRPLSEDVGFTNCRGAWEVRLTEIVREINP
jgi:hypothetical protein